MSAYQQMFPQGRIKLQVNLTQGFAFHPLNLCHGPTFMTVGERLQLLRRDLGLSQGDIGALGFVSTFGWIKIEHGQRAPSDELIHRLISWLINENHISVSAAGALREQLLTLKYLGDRSPFVRKLAYHYAVELFAAQNLSLSEDPTAYRIKPRNRALSSKKHKPLQN